MPIYQITDDTQILIPRTTGPEIFDKFLEKLINLNQRKGERFLKILPYKEWEVYSELRKGEI